jgi:hypothetical protein
MRLRVVDCGIEHAAHPPPAARESGIDGLVRIGRADAAGSDNRLMTPQRAPWNDVTQDVLICAAESLVKKHPRYAAAKGGSLHDAWALSSELLSRVPGSDVAPLLSRRPTLVAVQAFEGASINRIPVAMAQWLAGEYGAPADRSIVQINRVGHTGSSGWNRLARQALFDGAVAAGKHYLLIDDFVGQGGTLANLRGHIVAKGGCVDACVAWTGQARSAKIALSQQALVKLRGKHADLDAWWKTQFGSGYECLTESEAGYLFRVDADTIRNRIAEARQGGIAG